MFEIRPAERKKTRLFMSIAGYSGSGKTFTALKIARSLTPQGKIVVIDTESAGEEVAASELYAEQFSHLVLPLKPPYRPQLFIDAIDAAVKYGAEVIIIDSVSQEWEGIGGCIEWADSLKTNKSIGWDVVKPEHTKFLTAMERCPVHIITTIRAASGIEMERNADGKLSITKVPLKLKQSDGFEFHPSIHAVLDRDDKGERIIRVEKTRYPEIKDGEVFLATNDSFMTKLKAALDTGIPTRERFIQFLTARGYGTAEKMAELSAALPELGKWSAERHEEMIRIVEAYLANR